VAQTLITVTHPETAPEAALSLARAASSGPREGARALADFFRAITCGVKQAAITVVVVEADEEPAQAEEPRAVASIECSSYYISTGDRLHIGPVALEWGEDMHRARANVLCAENLARAINERGAAEARADGSVVYLEAEEPLYLMTEAKKTGGMCLSASKLEIPGEEI